MGKCLFENKTRATMLLILILSVSIFMSLSFVQAFAEEQDNSDGYYTETSSSDGENIENMDPGDNPQLVIETATYDELGTMFADEVTVAWEGIYKMYEEETEPIEDPVDITLECKNSVKVISQEQENLTPLLLCSNNRTSVQQVTKGDTFTAYVVCNAEKYMPLLDKTKGDYLDVTLVRVDGTNQWLLTVPEVTSPKKLIFKTKAITKLNEPLDTISFIERWMGGVGPNYK